MKRNTIKVENGDTCMKIIKILCRQPSGTYIYIPCQGDILELIITNLDNEELITSEFVCDGENYPVITFETNLFEGRYKYTLKLFTLSGEVHTLAKEEKLIIE